ncbi:MAG: type II secretion system F family protein [Candidatus Aadella gelida]|nr:type II secretion system F family protein [Candidatus Aadella gelida]
MSNFTYVAKDQTGHTVKGEVQALDKKHALDILRGKELLILKLEIKKEKKSFFSSLKKMTSGKVPLEELVIFSRQMATMTGAGITIIESLDTLADQVDNVKLKTVLKDVHNAVNTGASLSEAMGKYASVFSSYFINMIKAGESSGMLEEVLDRVALHLEKTSSLQKKISSAMVYPSVVTGMAIVITLAMIIKVIPVFEDMFSGLGADLPKPTQVLISLSNFMQQYFIVLVAAIGGSIFGLKFYAGTQKGHHVIDGFKLKLPVFGPLFRKVAISKFTRTLGTLVKSGVPILSALDIVAKTSGNVVVEKTVYKVKESVREGESIASPMEKSGIFPPLVTRMIAVGEKSGELEMMLEKIADFYDEQVDSTVDGLTSLIEPLVIAFLGIVIGGIVVCMFLPIFKMSTYFSF